MKKTWRKIPLFAVAALLAGFIVYGFWPQPVDVDGVVVDRGSFDITVSDDGETRIRERYVVTSPVTAKMLRIELHAGDVVRRGETVLARFVPGEPEPLDARSQAEAEARVRAAEAACESAAARSKRSSEELELAEHEYDRARSLVVEGTLSQGEFDRAEHQFRMAKASLRSADFAVRVAGFERDVARAALIRAQGGGANDEAAATFTLVSPIDGQVLRVFTEDAGIVQRGMRILELGDPSDLEVEIDVLSSEAVRIKPGATVYVDHWGGEGTLEGVVRVVEPAAFLKVSALGVEEKRVNIIADFRSPPEDRESLGDGFRIEARIVVDTADDVVKVPTGALFRQARAWHVYHVENGKARLRQIEVGKTNGLEVEVLTGLSLGDVTVLHPTDEVTDGASVRVVLTKQEGGRKH